MTTFNPDQDFLSFAFLAFSLPLPDESRIGIDQIERVQKELSARTRVEFPGLAIRSSEIVRYARDNAIEVFMQEVFVGEVERRIIHSLGRD